MYEHLYNYGHSQHNDIKDIQPYGDASDTYDYSNSLTDINSTVALPAFAFLSQQTDLAAHLQIQDPNPYNNFHHDITNNSGNNHSNNNTHMNAEDDHTHTLNQFRSAFESIDQNNITDATFSLQNLYNPVDINSIVHNPILPVPDLSTTLPPLNTTTTLTTITTPTITASISASLPSSSLSLQPTTSVIQPEELSPASKKQKIIRGARERAPWTPAEDTRLRFAVQLFGDKTEKWAKIAEYVPGRTNKNCRKRWFHSLDPSLRKGAWTDEEDRILREGVIKFPNQWSKIADLLEGRTDDQCAKRWRESLDPSIDRSDWTSEEDKRLADKYEEFGSQWQKIAQFFDGRPGLHCRNRWRKLQRISQIKKEKAKAVALGSMVSTTTSNSNSNNTSTNIQINGKKNDHQHLNNNNDQNNSNHLTHRNNNLSSNMNMNTTSFINLGPDDSSSNRFKNNNTNSNNNDNNNQLSGKLSISLTSINPSNTNINISISTPPLSNCSMNSTATPLLTPPDTISPSENSALSSLLQQNTSSIPTPQYEMPPTTTFKTINTSYQSMNDRHQQDYDFPEPLAHLKPYGCDVNGCFQTFGQSSELFYHMKNNHPSLTGIEKPYRCAIINCSKKYKNINGLQYHLREAKGISSHTLALSTSDNNNNTSQNNNNNNGSTTKIQHHGELMTPIPLITKYEQNQNNNNDQSISTTDNNHNLSITTSLASSSSLTSPTFVNLSTNEASSHLNNISINNGMKENNKNNSEGNPFLICPFIDCKKTFTTLNELRLHQNHGHRMTFALTSTPISTKKDLSLSTTTTISNSSLVDSLLQSSNNNNNDSNNNNNNNNHSNLNSPTHQQFRFRKEKWELV